MKDLISPLYVSREKKQSEIPYQLYVDPNMVGFHILMVYIYIYIYSLKGRFALSKS